MFVKAGKLKEDLRVQAQAARKQSLRQSFHRSRTAARLSGEAESSASPGVLRDVSGVVC